MLLITIFVFVMIEKKHIQEENICFIKREVGEKNYYLFMNI